MATCLTPPTPAAHRSIPIVSRRDFTNPQYHVPGDPANTTCGEGTVSWNTVAGSPFAREVSVGNWGELPALLDRLQRAPDNYIDKLQVKSDPPAFGMNACLAEEYL